MPPGTEPGPGQIVYSNVFALAALARREGAEVIDLGILPDRLDETIAGVRRAREAGCDVLLTAGGASVGDYDLVQPALAAEGLALSFWKVAVRPGKPLLSGRLGAMRVLGLPGNPVSAYVCAVLFLVPLLRRLAGRSDVDARRSPPACSDATCRRTTSGPITCVQRSRSATMARWSRHPFRCRTPRCWFRSPPPIASWCARRTRRRLRPEPLAHWLSWTIKPRLSRSFDLFTSN